MVEKPNKPVSVESGAPMTLLDRVSKIWSSFITWVWTAPDSGKGNLFNLIKAFVRIVFIVIREFQRDRITLRASALTFTIVLSLVPVLALGTAVLKGLGGGNQMRQAAYRFIEQLEEKPAPTPEFSNNTEEAVETPTGIQSTDKPTKNSSEDAKQAVTLTSHLRKAVDQIFDYVNRTNFAALGAFGVVGLVLAVLSVLGSIEQSMNTIWQTDSGRPLGRRLIDYLALMILLPITINLALATETTLQSPDLLARFRGILPIAWLGHFLLSMLPMIAIIATFTIFYRFIPNTKVRFLPALAGGILGGLGWLLVQMAYIRLQIGVARYNAIYGSFATLPLLLMWIYIGWVVFLAGAETAFAAQVWRRYIWKEVTITPIVRLAMAFDIIGVVLADFHARRISDPASLARQLGQSFISVNEVIAELQNGGILRQVDGETFGYVPAAPEEEIQPAEIIDLILGANVPSIAGGSLATEALNAARLSLAGKKIFCAAGTKQADPENHEPAKEIHLDFNNKDG